MARFLSIFEVSQKQAFIFSSNKLKDNIKNSDTIAYLTSFSFFKTCVNDAEPLNDDNLVYFGGGHIILEFSNQESAISVSKKVTEYVIENYPDICLMTKILEYDDQRSPSENIKELRKQLEIKKSIRKNVFHQGSFGIEHIDTNTRKPNPIIKEIDFEIEDRIKLPNGFEQPYSFDMLGNEKYNKNFIAVVHIDGNGMGKRIEEFSKNNKNLDWNDYKKKFRDYSESISKDYVKCINKMYEIVAENINSNKLNLDFKSSYFPVRKLIAEGDDICLVCEGRIGIECAAICLKELNKIKNEIDNQNYFACAGVAIVHTKYPFYKAYELAEMLCSNAKSYAVTHDMGDSSLIDWHIELGEIQDSLSDIRKDYIVDDNNHLELRPYVVCSSNKVNHYISYNSFRGKMSKFINNELNYSRSDLKQLRNVMKKGINETEMYLRFHKIEKLAEDMSKDTEDTSSKNVFVKVYNNEYHSNIFDVIEIADVFKLIEAEEGK